MTRRTRSVPPQVFTWMNGVMRRRMDDRVPPVICPDVRGTA